MQNFINKISIGALSHDLALISDKTGIALSGNPLRAKEYYEVINNLYFVEEIILVLVRKGNAKVKVNLYELEVEINSIINLTPNDTVEILEYSDDLEVDILLFNYDAVANLPLTQDIGYLAELFSQHPSLNLDEIKFKELSELYAILAYHCNKQELYHTEITQNLLYTICYLLVQFCSEKKFYEKKATNRAESIYKEFFSLLFRHYKTQRSVQFYADELNITPKYFSKVIKEMSTKNASDLIDEMVITGIKATLKCTKQTILQISEEFNFPNASFFGTYFKKRTGCTPNQYRKM